MLASDRADGGKAEIIGPCILDRLTVVDRPGTCERGRRQNKGDDSQEKRVTAPFGVAAGSLALSSPHRSVAPVFLPASATIFCATASISASVSVFSRGCNVTATPIDFLPSGTPTPS